MTEHERNPQQEGAPESGHAPRDDRSMRDRDDRALDAALDYWRRTPPAPADGVEQKLLAGFDAFQRKRRAGLSLATFADAFGWRALSRPISAAALLSAICVTGFAAGALGAAPADNSYIELAAAFDQSFYLSEEIPAWAEE